jgi:ligand-binding SRPBCC domain-containing protein
MHPSLSLGSKTHELRRTQWVPGDVESVFGFFEDPNNLARITPESLGFHILRMVPDRIQEGTIIEYRLKFYGFPYMWRTLIEGWTPGSQFVDTQSKGPYCLWHHTHTFTKAGDGVLVEDVVKYRMPFGFLGDIMHALIVKAQLKQVFDHRVQKIAEFLCDGKVYLAAPAN